MRQSSWVFYIALLNLSYRKITACDVKNGYFQCSTDKRCIEKHELCDDFEDCIDGEDEILGCAMKVSYLQLIHLPTIQTRSIYFQFDCTGPMKFLCQDRKCIPRMFHCDGVVDCEDGSDENNCPG